MYRKACRNQDLIYCNHEFKYNEYFKLCNDQVVKNLYVSSTIIQYSEDVETA